MYLHRCITLKSREEGRRKNRTGRKEEVTKEMMKGTEKGDISHHWKQRALMEHQGWQRAREMARTYPFGAHQPGFRSKLTKEQ